MLGATETKLKWICPSDRVLTLRSKLNLGWSIHTHYVFQRCESLQDSEVSLVLHVISRAEKINLFEQERVGRMVERLANMKKNAVGDGSSSCAMCARSFSLIRYTNVSHCYDCTKAVCNKCCVDTCSVIHEPCMLCKICAENREVWKKSGGWFYKSLPVHILPSQLEVKGCASPATSNRSYSTWSHRTPEIVRMQSFEPPEENPIEDRLIGRNWALNSCTDLRSELSEDVSKSTDTLCKSKLLHPESAAETNIGRKNSMQYLTLLESDGNLSSMSLLSSSCPSLVVRGPASQDMGTVEFSLRFNSLSQSLQCTIYSVKNVRMEEGEVRKCFVKIHLIPVSKKTIIFKTKLIDKSENMEFDETIVFPRIKHDALTKRSMRLLILDEDPFKDEIIGETSIDLKNLKAMQSQFFTESFSLLGREVKRGNGTGSMLVGLRYSAEDNVLHLYVVCCSDLPSNHKSSARHYHLKAELFPGPDTVKDSSSVKSRTNNPTFNEEFIFYLKPFEVKKKTVKVSLTEKSSGKFTRRYGYVLLGIQARGQMLHHWLQALQNPGQNVEKWHQLIKEA